MKTAEKVISGIVHMVTKAEAAPWPPFCIGIMYQPERPVLPAREIWSRPPHEGQMISPFKKIHSERSRHNFFCMCRN